MAASAVGRPEDPPGRAVIVDDHDEFRTSASALLRDAGWDVVATAHDAASAMAAVQLHEPDLVLLDVGLTPGGTDGIEVAHRLAALATPPTVVLVSARSARAYGVRLDEAPARGFLCKTELTGRALAQLVR